MRRSPEQRRRRKAGAKTDPPPPLPPRWGWTARLQKQREAKGGLAALVSVFAYPGADGGRPGQSEPPHRGSTRKLTTWRAPGSRDRGAIEPFAGCCASELKLFFISEECAIVLAYVPGLFEWWRNLQSLNAQICWLRRLLPPFFNLWGFAFSAFQRLTEKLFVHSSFHPSGLFPTLRKY